MNTGTKVIVATVVLVLSVLAGLGLGRWLWPYYAEFRNRPDPKVYVSVSTQEKSLFYDARTAPGQAEISVPRGTPVFFYGSYVEAKSDAKAVVCLNGRVLKEYPLTGSPGIPHTLFQQLDLANEPFSDLTKPNVIELRKQDAQGRTTGAGMVRVLSK